MIYRTEAVRTVELLTLEWTSLSSDSYRQAGQNNFQHEENLPNLLGFNFYTACSFCKQASCISPEYFSASKNVVLAHSWEKRTNFLTLSSRKSLCSHLRWCVHHKSVIQSRRIVYLELSLLKSAKNSLQKTVDILCSDPISGSRSQLSDGRWQKIYRNMMMVWITNVRWKYRF